MGRRAVEEIVELTSASLEQNFELILTAATNKLKNLPSDRRVECVVQVTGKRIDHFHCHQLGVQTNETSQLIFVSCDHREYSSFGFVRK
ncbi:MAG TPA: hypothetical protein VD907_04560 [Verrucomicrobiae bacterium]|nr:hypothetical protein [Verrucomicrobiae bacterium]